VPTKTGDKIRIIVLGTGPDAETARLIAESDADVALAAKFTKTVTHLVIDDTVKTTEARVKKAEEAGVPVLPFAEFKALLVAGAEDEVEEAAEEVVEAETPVAVAEVDEAPDAGPDLVEDPVEAAAEDSVVEDNEVEDGEPVTVKAEEAEPVAEPEPAAPVAEDAPEAAIESVPEPVAEAIDEPEEAAADPDKAVPSQAEAPDIENDAKSGDAEKSGAKPGLIAKIKSIFGLTGARK